MSTGGAFGGHLKNWPAHLYRERLGLGARKARAQKATDAHKPPGLEPKTSRIRVRAPYHLGYLSDRRPTSPPVMYGNQFYIYHKSVPHEAYRGICMHLC